MRQKFEKLMHALFQQTGANLDIRILASDEGQAFINTHAAALNSSFKKVEMSADMRRRLQRSNYIFSGIKTFHELNEAFPSLLDGNGERKPFNRFLQDVQKIDETYNKHYLRAEYNFVHASASMAANWERFAEDGDRYNLQYRTAHDSRVRPKHAALDGVTLPISDPFWARYYPPNGWNCRCTVVQVRRAKYPTTPHDEAIARGEDALEEDTNGIFSFNPGMEKKAVPDYNPYTIRRCRDCDVAKGKAKLAFVPENELCAACKVVHGNQAARTDKTLRREEFKEVRDIATRWADRNLQSTTLNGKAAKRTTKRTADGHHINVGKKFFTEVAAKAARDPELAHLLKTATEFAKWIPSAVRIGIEQGKHHRCAFSVYQVRHNGQTIEFKCKMTDGECIYTMKIV